MADERLSGLSVRHDVRGGEVGPSEKRRWRWRRGWVGQDYPY